jgi:hypothetical protein
LDGIIDEEWKVERGKIADGFELIPVDGLINSLLKRFNLCGEAGFRLFAVFFLSDSICFFSLATSFFKEVESEADVFESSARKVCCSAMSAPILFRSDSLSPESFSLAAISSAFSAS